MKTSQFKITTIIFILVPFFVFGQTTRSKEINKHYTVSPDGKLSIDGKYGDVQIESWDKNEVDVAIKIEVTKRSADKAEQYLDKINIDIKDGSKNDLSFKTMIEGNINNGKNERMRIVYKVKVPKTFNLNLKNNYGNLYLDDLAGNVVVNVAYGNVNIGALTGRIDFKLSYGNGEIEKVANGKVVVRYSNLDMEDSGNVEVENSYSNIDIETSQAVDLSNKYGNLTWGKLKSLSGYSKYGTIRIDKLYKSLVFDVMYGGGIKIGWISKDFTTIEVESAYASVVLKFEPGMSAMLDAEMKYCDLRNYDIDFDHSYIDESGALKYYRGKLGKGNFASKIKVNAAYGNVKIGYAD